MKCKMPLLAVLALVLFSIIASADIGFVHFDQAKYNLGDKLKVVNNISIAKDSDVLLRIALKCPSAQIEYFVAPLSLTAGKLVEVPAPAFTLVSSMLGDCVVNSRLSSLEGETLSEASSSSFIVGGDLGVSVETPDREIRPSEGLEVKAVVTASYAKFSASEVTYYIDSKVAEKVLTNISSFTHRLKLFENISSGEHSLTVNVVDAFGNSGTNLSSFAVAAVPTRVEVSLEPEAALPGDELSMSVLLYDQAGQLINEDASIEIYNPGKDKIFADTLETGKTLTYKLAELAAPGAYAVKAYSAGLKTDSAFSVKPLEQLDVDIKDKKLLTFSNTGNVDYDGQANILLTSNDWEYLLKRDVSLKPTENMSFNLFKEVPAATYTVKVVKSDGSTVIFENVITEDERSVAKKTSDTLGAIATGLIPGIDVGPEARGTASRVPGFVYVLVLAAGLIAYLAYRRGQRETRVKEQPSQPVQQPPLRLSPKKVLDSISKEQREEFPVPPKKPGLRIKSPAELSRDDPEVRQWLENLKRDKKF